MNLSRLWRRYLGDPQPQARAPGDLERRLARLAVAGRTRVGGRWGGAYRSAFRGEGLEFAGVREYQPGDDTRTLDWRVWARTGSPAVRRYVEERDRRVWLLVDVGADSECGSGSVTLRELAGEAVAVLGSAAVTAGDRVGLLAWARRRAALLPPRKDRGAVSRLVHCLLETPPATHPWDATGAMADLRRLTPRPAVVVVVTPRMDRPDVVAGIRILARRHQLLLVRTWDTRSGVGRGTGSLPAFLPGGGRGKARGTPPPALPRLPGRTATLLAGGDAATALGRALAAPGEEPRGG